MNRISRRAATIVAAAVAVPAAVVGLGAASGSDSEAPISGDALSQASRAALVATGEGRVTGTEVGDEESLYEIEVTLDDGSQVDVQLDESFAVVGSEADAEEAGDSD